MAAGAITGAAGELLRDPPRSAASRSGCGARGRPARPRRRTRGRALDTARIVLLRATPSASQSNETLKDSCSWRRLITSWGLSSRGSRCPRLFLGCRARAPPLAGAVSGSWLRTQCRLSPARILRREPETSNDIAGVPSSAATSVAGLPSNTRRTASALNCLSHFLRVLFGGILGVHQAPPVSRKSTRLSHLLGAGNANFAFLGAFLRGLLTTRHPL